MVSPWNVPSDLGHGLGKTNVIVKAGLRAGLHAWVSSSEEDMSGLNGASYT